MKLVSVLNEGFLLSKTYLKCLIHIINVMLGGLGVSSRSRCSGSMSLHWSLSTAPVVLRSGWCRAAAPFTLTKTMGAFCCSRCSSSCICCVALRCSPPSRGRPSCGHTGAGTGPSWTSVTRSISVCRIWAPSWKSTRLLLLLELGSMLFDPDGILQGRFILLGQWCPL